MNTSAQQCRSTATIALMLMILLFTACSRTYLCGLSSGFASAEDVTSELLFFNNQARMDTTLSVIQTRVFDSSPSHPTENDGLPLSV